MLSTVPVTAKKGCGWPSKLTWRLRPRHRLAVAVGTWTGPLSLPDGTGIVTAEVVAGGRGVDVFKVQITCTNGNGEDFASGPPANEFVSATGAFEGWHTDANAMWHGRFGADGVLRGTLVVRDRCGTGGQVNGTFTARHTAG